MLCSLILDNAIENAFKHGQAQNPGVVFTIRETAPPSTANPPPDHLIAGGLPLVHLTFTVTNRSNLHRPVVTSNFLPRLLAGDPVGQEDNAPVLQGTRPT